jgi:hypothetical protein
MKAFPSQSAVREANGSSLVLRIFTNIHARFTWKEPLFRTHIDAQAGSWRHMFLQRIENKDDEM